MTDPPGRWSGYAYVAPYAIVFIAFVVLPFVVSLTLSFCQYDLVAQRPPRFVGFANYKEAIHDPYFWKALGVTCRYVVWIIPTQLIVSMLLGLGMHAMTRGQRTIRAMLFLPGMFSIAVTGILWQWFYNQEFGLFNSLFHWIGLPGVPWLSSINLAMPSIVLMTLWWTVGGSAAVVLTGLQQIPRQIHEAASIDGANAWQSFWQITLPMLKPVLLFMVVMNTIGAFQMFAQSMILTGGGPEMSTRGVVSLIYDTAFANYRLGYGAAISWLLFLFIAAFSFLQFRLIRRVTE
jgi:multiple sugar transport system permease protein